MYFSELIVEAFGQHIKQIVKLTPGLNVIVGESETGKSTLIRALFLLIENSPRGGEKLYKSWLTDKPMMIQLKDDKNNKVKRSKNKYYLNGEPLKAFGTSVPEPIRELLNFKEINWQKQHDAHYLLFSTGGRSAKLLNSATGMIDQESIIVEIKGKLSDSKGEVKRIKKNNEEHLQTLERLKNITRYKLKAEAILNLHEEIIEFDNKSARLLMMLTQLEEIKETKEKYRKVKTHMETLEQILEDYKEIDVFKSFTNRLINLLNKLGSLETFDHIPLIEYLQRLQRLERLNSELAEARSVVMVLEKYIKEVQQASESQQKYVEEMKKIEKEIEATFYKLGYCPYCNREIEDGDTCCRR